MKSARPSSTQSGTVFRIIERGMMSNSKIWVSSCVIRRYRPSGWLVDREHDAVALRLRKRRHALGYGAREQVLLLEFAVRLEHDQRDAESQIVPEVCAYLLIGPLSA